MKLLNGHWYIGIVLMLVVFSSNTSQATPISYSFTGTGSGDIASSAFTDTSFSVTINADTNDVAFQPSLAWFGIVGLTGTIDISGIGLASFTRPLFVFGGKGMDVIGFGNEDNSNLIAMFATGQGMGAYDLISNFGPIVSQNDNDLKQFQNVATSLGSLSYRTMSDVTFQSRVATTSVPEPTTLTLSAIGLAGLFVARRFSGRRRS